MVGPLAAGAMLQALSIRLGRAHACVVLAQAGLLLALPALAVLLKGQVRPRLPNYISEFGPVQYCPG
jgi:hypothetical protein